ncbi:hypothetical protein BH20CHL3_BH20CHL3_01670 [soil metagenome]
MQEMYARFVNYFPILRWGPGGGYKCNIVSFRNSTETGRPEADFRRDGRNQRVLISLCPGWRGSSSVGVRHTI